jgi:hypothetical protein
MPEVTVTHFKTAAAFRTWLRTHHRTEPGLAEAEFRRSAENASVNRTTLAS